MPEQATGVPSGASAKGYAVAPSSPSGQKRPRDYGEELKGLTSDEDGRDASSPASKNQKKKKKLHHRRSGSVSTSESLDDGEIVESSSSRPGSRHDAEAPSGPAPSETQPAESSSPAGTDKPAGTTQQPLVGFNQGVSLGVRTSFGKGATTPFPAARSRGTNALGDATSNVSSSPTSSREGETKEVQQASEKASPSEESAPELAEPAAVETDSSPLLFTNGKATWQIPRLPVLEIPETADVKNEGFWHRQVLLFTVALFQTNHDLADNIDTKSLRLGIDKYASKEGGFLQGMNKHTKAARKVLQQVISDKTALASMIKKARDIAQTSQSVEAGNSGNSEQQPPMLADEEYRQQQKYFPNAEHPSEHCLSCAAIGHGARNCPQRACRFCKSGSHHSLSCPTIQRCLQCRQLGHRMNDCTEKLALAAEEEAPCAFCGGEHLEHECSDVWRSYDPANATIKKVKALPAFCYTCGGAGHNGAECALPSRGSDVRGRTSWSRENREFYVDPESDLSAIAWVGIPTETAGFQIRGRATRSTHTHFTSDEESDDGFIQEPVQKPQPRGQIRIASNIADVSQGGVSTRRSKNDQSRRRQQETEFAPPPPPPPGVLQPPQYNGGSSWQPPLPSGPPPPLQTNGFQGSTASLPPRPNTFTQGFGRGQQPPRPPNSRGGGGRGGYRGGGGRGGRRGNGRGRGH